MIVCGFVRNSLINIMTRGDDLSLPGLFFIKYNVFHPSETKFMFRLKFVARTQLFRILNPLWLKNTIFMNESETFS